MVLNCLLFAAALSAGNAELDRVSSETAAQISLGRLRRELVATGPATGLLERTMLAAPGNFRDRTEAEAACRLVYTAALDQAFAQGAAQLRDRLKLGSDFSPRLSDGEIEKALTGFPARYAAERKAACAAQAKTIAATIRPAEAAFETEDEAALRETLVEKVASVQKVPVFDENRAYISEKIVDPLLKDARAEIERQREYVLSCARCEAYAPSALAKELEANLRRNVAKNKAKASDPARAWDVFPGTLAATLPKAVEKRTLARAVKSVDDTSVDAEPEALAKRIAAQPTLHRRTADSEKHFTTAFAAEVRDAALARTVREAPSAERDELAAYLKQHAEEASLVKAAESRVRRDVLPALKAARAKVSADEFGTRWPSLLDGSWHPDAALADAVLAHTYATREIGEWRKMDAVADLKKGGEPLLEETDVRADRAVAAAFDRARNAQAAQKQLVEKAHPAILHEALARKNSFFRRTPDLEKIVELLTDEVTARWTQTRTAVLWPDGVLPANASEQYADLFPSVKRLIELEARQIFNEMMMRDIRVDSEEKPEEKPPEEPPPEEKPPEEPPPEEPPPEEPPPEEPPPEPLAVFSIKVEKSDGAVKVQLLQGKSEIVNESAKENMDDFSGAMKRVTERLGRDLLKLR